MRWKASFLESNPERYMKWTKWFAWYPVEMKDGTNVWLEIIYRHRSYPRQYAGFEDKILLKICYEYRYDLADVIRDGELPN